MKRAAGCRRGARRAAYRIELVHSRLDLTSPEGRPGIRRRPPGGWRAWQTERRGADRRLLERCLIIGTEIVQSSAREHPVVVAFGLREWTLLDRSRLHTWRENAQPHLVRLEEPVTEDFLSPAPPLTMKMVLPEAHKGHTVFHSAENSAPAMLKVLSRRSRAEEDGLRSWSIDQATSSLINARRGRR